MHSTHTKRENVKPKLKPEIYQIHWKCVACIIWLLLYGNFNNSKLHTIHKHWNKALNEMKSTPIVVIHCYIYISCMTLTEVHVCLSVIGWTLSTKCRQYKGKKNEKNFLYVFSWNVVRVTLFLACESCSVCALFI